MDNDSETSSWADGGHLHLAMSQLQHVPYLKRFSIRTASIEGMYTWHFIDSLTAHSLGDPEVHLLFHHREVEIRIAPHSTKKKLQYPQIGSKLLEDLWRATCLQSTPISQRS